MKTKTSKKIVSLLLAVMMVVTSLPITSSMVFGAGSTVTDPAVTAVEEAMTKFENKLLEPGTMINIDTAYAKYVDCQKALDAYIYGGEANALDGKANALSTAVDNIQPFVPKTAENKTPSFPGSSTADMAPYAGTAYSNLLWSSQATSIGSAMTYNTSGSATYVGQKLFMATDTVLLYDGTTSARIPVLADAYKSNTAEPAGTDMGRDAAGKTRHVFGIYPTTANNAGGDNADDPNFGLVDFWHTAASWNGSNGDNNSTNSWVANYNATVSKPGFNFSNASVSNKIDANKSADLTQGKGSWNWGQARYNAPSIERHFSNILEYKGGYFDGAGKTYTIPYWQVTSGDTAADAGFIAGVPINIVNYKYLLTVRKTVGDRIETIDLADYSEGSLTAYFTALENATKWDPNTYFTSSNNYNGCINDMTGLVNALNSVKLDTKDSTAYQTLRDAMTEAVRTTYALGNDKGGGVLRYTADSWSKFVTAYENAKGVMAATNDTGYTNNSCVNLATALTEAYAGLVLNVQKVDTTALMAIIDKFESCTNIFTAESYNSVKAVVQAAKEAVWEKDENGEVLYGVKAAALDLTPENTVIVADQVVNVEEAIKGLRLNMDYVVTTEVGKYSLNTALALENEVKDHKEDYGNYATFATAVANANSYASTAAGTDFSDYTAQLDEYKAEIVKLVKAFEGLTYSFTKIPDGTIATSNPIIHMQDLYDWHHNDTYENHVQFSYQPNAVIFKTTHDAKTYRYGSAYVKYGVTISSLSNNTLDSITINGTADNNPTITDRTMVYTPGNLDDATKTTYAGCLAVDGFSLTNFRFNSQENNGLPYLGADDNGNEIKDTNYQGFTDIFATTNGTDTGPGRGTIGVVSSRGGMGSVTYEADMNVDVPATSKVTLGATTGPASKTYSLLNKRFGATYVWGAKDYAAGHYCGYGYLTAKGNNQVASQDETINSSVTVVDITNLVELVELCNSILGDANKYTEATWNEFTKRLVDAQADMNYTQLTGSQITNQCKTRYSNLWRAYSNLVVKDMTVTFKYKDANAADTSTVLTLKYGDMLTQDAVDAIVAPQYIANNRTYTFKSWTPAVDLATPVTANRIYTAEYTWVVNTANWDAYDAALQSLKNKFTDNTYSVAVLQSTVTTISGLKYVDFTEDQKNEVMGSSQSLIDAETATLTSLITALDENAALIAAVDYSTGLALVEAEKEKYKNDDMYSGDQIMIGSITDTVTVFGDEVIGYIYDNQKAIDDMVAAALNSKEIREYNIELNGTVVATVPYGTSVIVDSDGAVQTDVDDTDPSTSGKANAAWYYSYSAPSNKNVPTAEKYMINAPSFGFVVKGDTYLTTKEVASSDTGYAVTFVSDVAGVRKTYDVYYVTDGKLTMPNAPAYAYYDFAGFSNGANAGDVINVTANTTIVANYTADTSTTYTVDFYEGVDSWDNMEVTTSEVYNYNERVDLTTSLDVYCWAIVNYIEDDGSSEFSIVSYSQNYSFYACQELSNEGYTGVIALTRADYEAIVEGGVTDQMRKLYDSQGNLVVPVSGNEWDGYVYPDPKADVSVLENVVPIYNNEGTMTKFSLVGTFILPEGYSIVEAGFLFTNQVGADLTIENVGTNGIARFKSSKYTIGNQFVINVGASPNLTTFDYVGYAVVKDADGNVTTCYSNRGGETNFNA